MAVNRFVARPRWLTISWVLICLLTLIVAGCGGKAPKQEPVTITFAFPEGPDRAQYEALVKKFQQSHPLVTIELRPKSSGALARLRPADADVFAVDASALGTLYLQNSLLNLDAFIAEDRTFNRADFYRGVLELFSRNGKTWAIPAGADLYVLYYNRDLFDKRGLPYPQTAWKWNDFLNSALALRDPAAGVYGYAAAQDAPDAMLFVYQHGGQLVDNLEQPTRVTFTDPKTIEAVRWYAGLFGAAGAAPTQEEASKIFGSRSDPLYFGIQGGKLGMWMGLLSERGGLTGPAQWKINWGMAPLPRDAQPFTGGLVEGYAISAETKQRETAWQWISFLSQEAPRRLASVRRSVVGSKAYEAAAGVDMAVAVRQSMENAYLISPWTMGEMAGVMQLFLQAIGPVVNQGVPAQVALEQAQSKADQVIK